MNEREDRWGSFRPRWIMKSTRSMALGSQQLLSLPQVAGDGFYALGAAPIHTLFRDIETNRYLNHAHPDHVLHVEALILDRLHISFVRHQRGQIVNPGP